MKNYKRQKGITLIALVVTVVILIILATISINAVFGENGLIQMAKKAKILNATKEKEEEVQFAITELLLENNMDASKVTVSAVVDKVKQNYKDQKSKNSISGLSEEEGSDNFPGIIQYDPPSSTIDETIIVTVDENLNVSAKANEQPKIELPESEYVKTENTYYNTPDLSKFNSENTYYVVYDKDGKNEAIYGRIDKVPAPGTENVPKEFKDMVWHNYEHKIWANVVTVNGEEVTYWTWIPRYVYKITSGVQETEIKFVDGVDGQNNYIDGTTDQVDNSQIDGYKLPESFTFASQNLKGYWVSKYEIQSAEGSGIEALKVTPRENSLNVTTSEIVEGTKSEDTYTIFLDGVKYKGKVTLPYDIEGLDLDREYQVCVYNETDKRMIGSTEKKITSAIQVDTSKFELENTYYVTYDRTGKNETIYGRMDKVDRPTNWYNYANKIWANVVTVNENNVTYWTYIPRYEYLIESYAGQKAEIQFIPVTKTTPDSGYKIPESFTFAEQQLPGYWVSKYEVQNAEGSGIEQLKVTGGADEIKITTSEITGETESTDKYMIFLDGEKYEENINLPYTIEGEDAKEDYDIAVYNETDKRMIGSAKTKIESAIQVDLSKFNEDCTYYVTYDKFGNNEIVGDKIKLDENGEPLNAPENWYNYDKKIWANVVTKGTDKDGKELTTYWTYIPRYEYLIEPYGDQEVHIQFIPSTKTTPDSGYKIPESFTFANQNLKGYWVSKYEIQGTLDN